MNDFVKAHSWLQNIPIPITTIALHTIVTVHYIFYNAPEPFPRTENESSAILPFKYDSCPTLSHSTDETRASISQSFN